MAEPAASSSAVDNSGAAPVTEANEENGDSALAIKILELNYTVMDLLDELRKQNINCIRWESCKDCRCNFR
jgi:hypothetical protein